MVDVFSSSVYFSVDTVFVGVVFGATGCNFATATAVGGFTEGEGGGFATEGTGEGCGGALPETADATAGANVDGDLIVAGCGGDLTAAAPEPPAATAGAGEAVGGAFGFVVAGFVAAGFGLDADADADAVNITHCAGSQYDGFLP